MRRERALRVRVGGYLSVMTDDLHNSGPRDRARINIHEEHEVRWWTHALGVSRRVLEAAVSKVGVSERAVREYLSKRAYS